MSWRKLQVAAIFLVAAAGLVSTLPARPAQQPEAGAPADAGQQAPAPAPRDSDRQRDRLGGYTLSPPQEAQAVAYARARRELYFLDVAYGFLVLILLLQLRVAPRIRDLAARRNRKPLAQAVFFSPLILLAMAILGLPTAAWGHRLAVQYQQSIQGWGSWLADWAKSQAVELAIGTLIIWILYVVIRKSPRRWWLHFWMILVPLIVLGAVAQPLIFEPLFFQFTPLAKSQPQLAARIGQMAGRAGLEIPPSRILVMDASTKLRSVNAYVSGLGATKRVVVWDTALARMTDDEILAVFGHEMGHYVLGHVFAGIVFAAGLLLVFLAAAYRLIHWMLARWGGAWEIRGVDDLASLPALILLMSLFGFLFTPISNAYSRVLEHQADQYGLEAIHGVVPDAPVVAAHTFQVLGEVDLEEPNPSTAVKLWFYSHPPLGERIRFALTYDPWGTGGAPRFVK